MPKVFSVTDEEWIAADSAEDAKRFYQSEVWDPDDVQPVEMTDEDLANTPFEYEDGAEIKTRTMAEQLQLCVAEGMVLPCWFASTDWR